jgi:hypothetical protein
MRAIAVVGWLGIVAALLVWQGIGLVHGPEWPTLRDFFRSFMTVPLRRFILFGLCGSAGTSSSEVGLLPSELSERTPGGPPSVDHGVCPLRGDGGPRVEAAGGEADRAGCGIDPHAPWSGRPDNGRRKRCVPRGRPDLPRLAREGTGCICQRAVGWCVPLRDLVVRGMGLVTPRKAKPPSFLRAIDMPSTLAVGRAVPLRVEGGHAVRETVELPDRSAARMLRRGRRDGPGGGAHVRHSI